MPEIPNIGSNQVIMGLLWVMVTGALIWVMDNFLKRFENVMEDGFRKQARNINDSFRINVTLLVISFSVYAYFKYNLKVDTSDLKSILGSLIDLVASVARFILYLLAYIVHYGYKTIDGSYKPGSPNPDGNVLLGFIVIFSYVVVKRLFFKKVPPILWAVIVASVMVGFNFLAKKQGWDINNISFLENTSKKLKGKEKVEQEQDTIPLPDQYDQKTTKKPTKPVQPKVVVTVSDPEIIILNENLHTAIENFAYLDRRTEPNPLDYKDNEPAYQQAIVEHISSMQSSDFYKKITDISNDLEAKGILNHGTIQITLQEELCPYYQTYFDDKICPRKQSSGFAN
jgi:translation initiation factor 2 beta subunit (eIF-2beta)/eIF-5